jgi:hypothetical protein
MSDAPPATVTISVERLKQLEALEADMPSIVARAKAERDKEKLEALHAARKANPEVYSKKVLEKYHKNKDEINARRRDAYRLKKEAKKTESEASTPA